MSANTQIQLDAAQQVKVIDMVMGNVSQSMAYLQSSQYLTEWKRWHDQYRSIPQSKPYTWMSNKFYPLTFSKTETAISNLYSLIFSTNPPFDIRPREKGDIDASMLIKNLLRYQLDAGDAQREMEKMIRSMCIFGTTVGKIIQDCEFSDELRWQPVMQEIMDPITGAPVDQRTVGYEPRQSSRVLFEGPRLICCALEDIFPDPNSVEIQDGWIVHRVRKPIDYLRQMHEQYPDAYNANVMLIQESDANPQKQKSDADPQSALSRLQLTQAPNPPEGGHVELHEFWGKYPADGHMVPVVFTVACGKYLIRATRSLYFHGRNPFVKGAYIRAKNEFYGVGIPEILDDLQNNANELINQRNDAISFDINKPTFFNKNAGLSQKSMTIKPGGKYGVDDKPQDVVWQPQSPGALNIDLYRHLQDIERYAQEATGITALTMGMGDSGTADTATGQGIQMQAASARMLSIAKNFENDVFTQVLKMFYALDYQFVTQPMAVRILGEQGMAWQTINPDDVRRDYDFVPSGVLTMENKQSLVLRLMQFFNLAKGDPAFKSTTVMKRIYQAMNIGDDPTEFLKTPAEIMAELQGRVAAAMVARHVAVGTPGAQSVNMGEEGDSGGGGMGGTPGLDAAGNGQFTSGAAPMGSAGMPDAAATVPPGARV